MMRSKKRDSRKNPIWGADEGTAQESRNACQSSPLRIESLLVATHGERLSGFEALPVDFMAQLLQSALQDLKQLTGIRNADRDFT
jgi:hypothetical protein